MFTSPQSKSFLNQDFIKSKILLEEYELIELIQ